MEEAVARMSETLRLLKNARTYRTSLAFGPEWQKAQEDVFLLQAQLEGFAMVVGLESNREKEETESRRAMTLLGVGRGA
jgi:hypothetical protein